MVYIKLNIQLFLFEVTLIKLNFHSCLNAISNSFSTDMTIEKKAEEMKLCIATQYLLNEKKLLPLFLLISYISLLFVNCGLKNVI